MQVALVVAIVVAAIALLGVVIWTSWSYQLNPGSTVKTWQYVTAMSVLIVGFATLAIADAIGLPVARTCVTQKNSSPASFPSAM